jgi:hypothetical protein
MHTEQTADNLSVDQDGGVWSASERHPHTRAVHLELTTPQRCRSSSTASCATALTRASRLRPPRSEWLPTRAARSSSARSTRCTRCVGRA